jgi:Ulp1 family protease
MKENSLRVNVETYNPTKVNSRSHGFIIIAPERKHKKKFASVLKKLLTEEGAFVQDGKTDDIPHFITALADSEPLRKLDPETLRYDFPYQSYSPEIIKYKTKAEPKQSYSRSRPKASATSSKALLDTSTSSIVSNSSQLSDSDWLMEDRAKPHNDVLVTYEKISITRSDLDRCDEGEFLNDNIIDFELKHFENQYNTGHVKHNIHIFHTTFYPLLTKDIKRAVERVPSLDRVKIFDTDFVFVPINEGAHWSLVVACFPSDKDRRSLMYCDSLYSSVKKLQVAKVAEYLKSRYKLEHPDDDDEIEFKEMLAELPKQNNSCDCGVYVIQYIEQIATLYPQDLPIRDTNWFDKKDISAKRNSIRENIQTMAANYKPEEIDNDTQDEVLDVTNEHKK